MSCASICFLLQLFLIIWPLFGEVGCLFLCCFDFFFCSAFSSLWLRKSPICHVGLLWCLPIPDLYWASLHCCLLLYFLSTFLNALALNLPVSDPGSWFWVWLQNSKSNIQLVIYNTLWLHNSFLWFFKTIHIQHWTNAVYRKMALFFLCCFHFLFHFLFYLFAFFFTGAIALTSCTAFTSETLHVEVFRTHNMYTQLPKFLYWIVWDITHIYYSQGTLRNRNKAIPMWHRKSFYLVIYQSVPSLWSWKADWL